MKSTLITKSAGALIAASLILPIAASAHGLDLKFGGDAKVDGKAEFKADLKDLRDGFKADVKELRADFKAAVVAHRDDRKDEHADASASTSAAVAIKKANRITAAADFLASFSAPLQARITSSAAAGMDTATVTAKLASYNSDLANAKVKASAAVVAAGGISSTTSTTTNATLLAEARADIRDARNFLIDAKHEIVSIWRALWSFAVNGSVTVH